MSEASLPIASASIVAVSPSAANAPSATPIPTAPATSRPTLTAEPTVAVRRTAPPPSARPSPRATTVATPPAGTNRPSTLVSHGPRTLRQVALTLDMGGRVGDAVAIVGWLVDHRVQATIFMTGAMADNLNTDAGRAVLGIIDAHPALFTLGNHSYGHPDFRTLTAAEIARELHRTEVALARDCRQDPRPFFRPPYGGYNSAVLAAVGATGYAMTVTWDIDTIDWRPIANDPPGPTADEIVTKVIDRAQGGSIVLMHLGGYETLAALPRLVEGLQAAGFQLVTLDRMLGV